MRTRWGKSELVVGIIVVTLVGATFVRAQQQGPVRANTGTEKVIRLTPDELTWTAVRRCCRQAP